MSLFKKKTEGSVTEGSAFEQIVKERRSAMNFIKNIEIPQEELEGIFELVRLVPSCFNLQHTEYLVVTDPAQKEKLREASFGQYKVFSSSAAIIVLGDTEAYKKADQIYSGMLNLKVMSQEEYDTMLSNINGLYEGRGKEFQKEEAIRNASLSAMLFMLAAKDKGWDTCPMIGFDPDAVKRIFNIPDPLIPVMMITLGKQDAFNTRQRGYRKGVKEFVKYETY